MDLSDSLQGVSVHKSLLAARRLFIADFESRQIVADISESLSRKGQEYFGKERQGQFIEYLLDKIRKKTPFSSIRTGDGEGNVMLAMRPGQHDLLARFAFDQIWHTMFGKTKISESQKIDFLTEFRCSLVDADFLGVPTREQVERRLESAVNGTDIDIRGGTGVLSNWYWLSENQDILASDKAMGMCHYHIRLGRALGRLLSEAQFVSAVTCYPELLNVLSSRYNIKPGLEILIPPQASNVERTPEWNHYPFRYHEITRQLERTDLSGHVFVVGAGLLGKIYCSAIKRSGGIALDIGSLIDVLVGVPTRLWHVSAILEQYGSSYDL
jgi:hypothetical protein